MAGTDSKRHILVVEDDPDITGLLKIHLGDLGYKVDSAASGDVGLRKALEGDYALVILDLMLPGLDGNEICRRIRETNKQLPILILTLKSELVDKVLGLELGADDSMTKPFSIQELVARVKALLRRSDGRSESGEKPKISKIQVKGLSIDLYSRRVTVSGSEIELTPKQFDLLSFLAQSPGRAYSRQDLLSYVWGYENSGYEHTVDTHVNRLRSKVEPDPSNPKFILTVWGIGYRFAEEREL